MKLPPLPAPDVTSLVSDWGEAYRSKPLYLANSVQAYARTAVKAALEEAAKEVSRNEGDWMATYAAIRKLEIE